MNLYNERMCCWCWDMDRIVKPAAWTLICTSGASPNLTSENLCDECAEHSETLAHDAADNPEDFDHWRIVEKKPFLENPIPVFVRGDRVEIVRVNRPRLLGTVIHCYVSMRDLSARVNIVIDGKKWPAVFPAHIVQKRTAVRPC